MIKFNRKVRVNFPEICDENISEVNQFVTFERDKCEKFLVVYPLTNENVYGIKD